MAAIAMLLPILIAIAAMARGCWGSQHEEGEEPGQGRMATKPKSKSKS